MTKKKESTILKERLDKIVKIEILTQYNFCFLCGRPAIELHHWMHGRDNTRYRFDPYNLLPICRDCHTEVHKGNISFEEVKGKALYHGIISIEVFDRIFNDNKVYKIYNHELEDMIKERK